MNCHLATVKKKRKKSTVLVKGHCYLDSVYTACLQSVIAVSFIQIVELENVMSLFNYKKYGLFNQKCVLHTLYS